MAFIDESEEIILKKVDQAEGALTGFAAGEVAGIIFDALTEAQFLEEFEIIFGAHADALGFDQALAFFELADAQFQFLANTADRALNFILGGDELVGGVEVEGFEIFTTFTGKGIERADAFDFVAPEFDADGAFHVGGEDVDRFAAHAELAAAELDIIAFIKIRHQAFQQVVAAAFIADLERNHHSFKILRRAEAVDTGDGGHDNDIAAADEGAGGGDAQAVDIFINGRILFDESIGGGDVGFGLVVIVIADKIFDGIVGKKAFEFAIELGGQRFVVGEDEGGALQLLDDIGHGKGFTGSGYAEQGLVFIVGTQRFRQLADGIRLIAGGLKFCIESKFHKCLC